MRGSAPDLINIGPINLDPKSGVVIQVQYTVAHLGGFFVEVVLNGVSGGAAVRLGPKCSIAKSRN